MKNVNILDLETQWIGEGNEAVLVWVNKKTQSSVLMSSSRNKYGDPSDRVISYKENSLLLPSWNYVARVYSQKPEDTVIGAAVINDRLYIQLQADGELFMLSKEYKEMITQEQYDEMMSEIEI